MGLSGFPNSDLCSIVMAVSINWGSFLWCFQNESLAIWGPYSGPPIFGNSLVVLHQDGLLGLPGPLMFPCLRPNMGLGCEMARPGIKGCLSEALTQYRPEHVFGVVLGLDPQPQSPSSLRL